MPATVVINEVYLSLQGESTFAGLPCIFVRFTGCDLRCSYCDTAYAFKEGRKMTVEGVREEVERLARPFLPPPAGGGRLPLVELTGGEPLLQKNSLTLMRTLCDDRFTVLLETSGAHDISPVDPRVHRVVDLKCPGSGEVQRNRVENLQQLRATDEVKFVISTVQDYEWASAQVRRHRLSEVCPVLFSWAAPLAATQRDASLKPEPSGLARISQRDLAERIIADALPVRFQVQMHKVIWPPDARGV